MAEREMPADMKRFMGSPRLEGRWPQHPLWYLNLQANPNVTIEVRREKLPMRARTANAQERAQLWPRLVALYGDYANYQSWTDREIPVVILSPRQ